jgi:hypothetical protein
MINRPSLKNLKNSFSVKKAKRLGLFLLAAATILDGGLLYNYAPSNKFTLKSNFGKVADETTSSGLYFHIPLAQYTHDYRKEVQSIEFNAGGMRFFPFGESTYDKNYMSSSLRLNYRVTEDTQKLGYHGWAMDGYFLEDGYWLLTDMMNQSANAVMGNHSMAETMADPQRYIEEYYEDLLFRFEQNNVPVEVESIEFEKFNTFLSTETISYQKKVNSDHAPPEFKP